MWLWHVIALALGGRTVAEWQNSMSRMEFEAWAEFYKQYPFDDLHRFHRPAALVSVSIGGGDFVERLELLQPPRQVASTEHTEADMNTLKAFGLLKG